MRIYVASLSDYNNGRLHGVWIDFPTFEEDAWEQIDKMLRSSTYPGDEWAIHASEGFGNLLPETISISKVVELADAIEEHGEPFIAYARYLSIDEAIEHFEECYQGEWGSKEDFAQDLADDLGMFKDSWSYIDWERFARDLFLDGFTYIDGYVFRDY